ncbi:hypothetical protein M8C13_08740 [Crossiella sp. SN42]|uniref:hypothetical protein n=1 Tax=Crossiella sp. SN42 TaxID=2944808 RepID=UPI00207CE819|nr:hypothetical protein [Crossiella sp. SN42]MCO1575842.1 hypothetical protein [Crossiella sp. SN42]
MATLAGVTTRKETFVKKMVLSAAARAGIAELAFQLCQLRREKGEPSLRALCKTMPCVVPDSASTLHRVFAGRTLPKWPVLEALLLHGFGVSAEEVEGTWKARWVEVKNLVDPLVPPQTESGSLRMLRSV